jgi:3-hydroxyisobutyrate dehydrogenase
MYAGADAACEAVEPVLAGLSDRRRRVGDRPGMAQALKLANNFLSATALAATSEAIAFGVSVGLDIEKILEVIDASSAQSAATRDKFPNHVLTGLYAAGFANSLMSKDLKLYRAAVEAQGTPSVLGGVTESVWEEFATAEPGARLHPHLSLRRTHMSWRCGHICVADGGVAPGAKGGRRRASHSLDPMIGRWLWSGR